MTNSLDESLNHILTGLEDYYDSDFLRNLRLSLLKRIDDERGSFEDLLQALEFQFEGSTQSMIHFLKAFNEVPFAERTIFFKHLNRLSVQFANDNLESIFKGFNSQFFQNLKLSYDHSDEKLQTSFLLKAFAEASEGTIQGFFKNLEWSYNTDDSKERFEGVFKALSNAFESSFMLDLHKSVLKFPEANYKDAFSRGQMMSKKWALVKMQEYLPKSLGQIYILGGWYGLLGAFINDSKQFDFESIRSFDIDPDCLKIANSMNNSMFQDEWKFKAETWDAMELEYDYAEWISKRSDGSDVKLGGHPDTIINTSCEHFPDFEKWVQKIPSGKKVVLQSNDYFGVDGHVSCCNDLGHFLEKANLKDVLFSGTLPFESYNRFMIIGIS